MERIAQYQPEKLVYIDESGIDRYLYQGYGWSERGAKIYGDISETRYQRESFVAAKCGNRILAPFCYRGTCNTTLFNTWVKEILIPELKPGQVIIMDNATFHKSQETRRLIQSAGCKLLYLPPYSPDLNPIEIFWANFKKKVTALISQLDSLSGAIDYAFLLFLSQLE